MYWEKQRMSDTFTSTLQLLLQVMEQDNTSKSYPHKPYLVIRMGILEVYGHSHFLTALIHNTINTRLQTSLPLAHPTITENFWCSTQETVLSQFLRKA